MIVISDGFLKCKCDWCTTSIRANVDFAEDIFNTAEFKMIKGNEAKRDKHICLNCLSKFQKRKSDRQSIHS